jgi:chromosome segregation ATPase
VRRLIDGIEAELIAERARREGAERRDRTLRDQIAKEAHAQQELRRERDDAIEELAAIKARLGDADRHKVDLLGQIEEQSRRIADLENERQRLMLAAEAARSKIDLSEPTTSSLNANNDTPAEPGVEAATSASNKVEPSVELSKPVEPHATESAQGSRSMPFRESRTSEILAVLGPMFGIVLLIAVLALVLTLGGR